MPGADSEDDLGAADKAWRKLYVDDIDLRHLINHKHEIKININKYVQVFSEKNGFINNLSIMDLIFNEGPNSLFFLKK